MEMANLHWTDDQVNRIDFDNNQRRYPDKWLKVLIFFLKDNPKTTLLEI